MQSIGNQIYRNRSLYYWARSYSKQLKEGSIYTDLQTVICINLIDFDLFPESRKAHQCFLLTEQKPPHEVLSEYCMLHFISLPKATHGEKRTTGRARAEIMGGLFQQGGSGKGRSGLAAHGPPLFLPCCASSQKRMVGPWLRTALPCFSHAAPARRKGWSGLGCARPSPVSPMLRQLAEKDGRALAAHGPPLFLPCCASSQKRMVGPWLRTALPCFSHAAPARMGASQEKQISRDFLTISLALRRERVYSLRRTSYFITLFHLLLKPFRPRSEHHLYALFCIIIPRSIALWNTSSVKFAHRSSLIAHRSSLIEKIKTI